MPDHAAAVETIEKFRRAFHFLTEQNYWPTLREAAHPLRTSTTSLTFHPDGRVTYPPSVLDDLVAHAASAQVRKFLSSPEPVFLPKVIAAAKTLGADDIGVFAEPKSLWTELDSAKCSVLVHEGNSIGIAFDELPTMFWTPGPFPEQTEPVAISLRDVAEVYFNEDLFHSFERRRHDEERRAIVRSIEPVLRDWMAKSAIATTVYCVNLIHMTISELRPEWHCDPTSCQEMRILTEKNPGRDIYEAIRNLHGPAS